MTHTEREAAIALEMANLLEGDVAFLDTETTGLGENDQVVEISVVDAAGQVLLDTLIRPTIPIPAGAAAVHGIGDADVAAAPAFVDVLDQIAAAVDGRTLVIYNAAFDLRMLHQSARAHGLELNGHLRPADVVCAMETYAEYWGDWNDYHGSYRWQRLDAAVAQQGVELPAGIPLHRARADAEATRRLILKIAEEATWNKA